MTCEDPSHVHEWPTEGKLIIARCETICNFCAKRGKIRDFKFAWFLRRHARDVHAKKEPEFRRLTVAKEWNEERGRTLQKRAANKSKSKKRGASPGRDITPPAKRSYSAEDRVRITRAAKQVQQSGASAFPAQARRQNRVPLMHASRPYAANAGTYGAAYIPNVFAEAYKPTDFAANVLPQALKLNNPAPNPSMGMFPLYGSSELFPIDLTDTLSSNVAANNANESVYSAFVQAQPANQLSSVSNGPDFFREAGIDPATHAAYQPYDSFENNFAGADLDFNLNFLSENLYPYNLGDGLEINTTCALPDVQGVEPLLSPFSSILDGMFSDFEHDNEAMINLEEAASIADESVVSSLFLDSTGFDGDDEATTDAADDVASDGFSDADDDDDGASDIGSNASYYTSSNASSNDSSPSDSSDATSSSSFDSVLPEINPKLVKKTMVQVSELHNMIRNSGIDDPNFLACLVQYALSPTHRQSASLNAARIAKAKYTVEQTILAATVFNA